MKAPRTEKQIAASRANGAKSKGPSTPEGKQTCARNSTREASLANTIVLTRESRRGFRKVLETLEAELLPETPLQSLFIQKMAVAHWRQVRAWNWERAGLTHQVRGQQPPLNGEDPPTRDSAGFFSLNGGRLTNYEMLCQRQFVASLDTYFKLKDRKSANEPGNLLETKENNPGNEPKLDPTLPKLDPTAPEPDPTGPAASQA